MVMPQNTSKFSRLVSTCAVVAWLSTAAANAQSLAEVKAPSAPLILKEQGSFFVGGVASHESAVDLSGPFELPDTGGGTVSKDKMYVHYMVPEAVKGPPLILVHGATLTGKTYETTPDGRMGWEEYFVRQGHAIYVPDQVGRGRSGFEIGAYNEVRKGQRAPDTLPNVFKLSNELGWRLFRFGPQAGTPFADEQFPVGQAGELANQSVPDLYFSLPQPDPNYKALSDLTGQVKGAILLGHSQSGFYPLEAALVDDSNLKGMVMIEPGRCSAPTYTDANYATFARHPILVVFGDHLDVDTGVPGVSWRSVFQDCEGFIKRVNAAGGDAQMLYPPALGIKGNSHMIMQDRNNLQIADLILKWADQKVDWAVGSQPKN